MHVTVPVQISNLTWINHQEIRCCILYMHSHCIIQHNLNEALNILMLLLAIWDCRLGWQNWIFNWQKRKKEKVKLSIVGIDEEKNVHVFSNIPFPMVSVGDGQLLTNKQCILFKESVLECCPGVDLWLIWLCYVIKIRVRSSPMSSGFWSTF